MRRLAKYSPATGVPYKEPSPEKMLLLLLGLRSPITFLYAFDMKPGLRSPLLRPMTIKRCLRLSRMVSPLGLRRRMLGRWWWRVVVGV